MVVTAEILKDVKLELCALILKRFRTKIILDASKN